jgi:cytoskeletal protein CcmA (bactofilin family)/Tfp pilus assembly protein PilV
MFGRTSLRSERGVALPIALGATLVISIALVTVLEMSLSSQRSSTFSKADQSALAVADAGLNQAESVLAQADAMNPAAMPSSGAPATVSVDGGSVQYWGSMDGSVTPHVWTLNATSTVANPSGGSSLSHTVSAQYELLGTAANDEAWNYVYSNSLACLNLVNNFDVRAPLYARGDVCLRNDANFLGPTFDVQGTVETRNTASVGTTTFSVPTVRVAGGCRFGTSGPFNLPCTTADRVWAASFNSNPPVVPKPTMDAAYWRTYARPGPNQYCTTGSFPGGATSFTTLGTVNLTPASTYDCTVVLSGVQVGRIAWNNTSSVLTIDGVVYFDGDIELNGNFNGTYTGRGVVYANTVSFRNDAKLCAISGCPTTGWDPNTAVLVLVARSTATPAVSVSNATKFQGAVYTAGGFRIENTASMQGPVIAESLDIQNAGLVGSWPPITGLLPGMPSNGGGPGYVRRIAGSWRG